MRPSFLTPRRQRGVEVLDDPSVPPAVRERSMNDVARANALFGGTRAMLLGFDEVARSLPSPSTHLDVGSGTGDIAIAVERAARRAGVRWFSVGMDISEQMARAARGHLGATLVGSALHIPFADDSVDLVSCSQVLHHFDDDDARQLIAELHRVSRGWVVIGDLRRSWTAAAGWWLASRLLRFHHVTQSDGKVSVLRGFTAAELSDLVSQVTGTTPGVRGSAFWRLSVRWHKRARPLRTPTG